MVLSTNPKSPITDKRPDPKNYTKWENPLPLNLEDFMEQYNAWKLDGVEHPEWKQQVVLEFERDLKDMIRIHWKGSSKTRLLFVSMNSEDVWVDNKKLEMHLTKRNLATLDPKFIPVLDQHVLSVMSGYIEDIRAEARAVLDAIYASDEERADVMQKIDGTEPENYVFESYGKHLDLQHEMRAEFRAKFPVIEYLRKREMFALHLIRFEEKHLNYTPAKGLQNVTNWLPKWRLDAGKILSKTNETATKLADTYSETTGKRILLYGQDYRASFLEPQKAQLSSIKTNFRHLTANVLFFDNPHGSTHGEPDSRIVEKIIDPLLTPLLDQAVQEPAPPAMPDCSDELEFTFKYY